MSGTTTAEEPPTNISAMEGKSPTAEKSAAIETNREQEMGSTRKISPAETVSVALGEESNQYRLLFPQERGTSQTIQAEATKFWSISNAAHKVLYVNINDTRAWRRLYGPAPAIALATFGRKSVWKMQAELLGRPGGPDPGDSGNPGDPGSPGGAGGPRGTNDPAAEEYKGTIEAESGRITISVCISIKEPDYRE